MAELTGHVMQLKELLAYQEGAVVSREIIRKGTGTITLFAFDEGQGLSEHTAPCDAFVYILDGEAVITIDSVPNAVVAGDMVVMPANKPHALKAVDRFKMLLVMIRDND